MKPKPRRNEVIFVKLYNCFTASYEVANGEVFDTQLTWCTDVGKNSFCWGRNRNCWSFVETIDFGIKETEGRYIGVYISCATGHREEAILVDATNIFENWIMEICAESRGQNSKEPEVWSLSNSDIPIEILIIFKGKSAYSKRLLR